MRCLTLLRERGHEEFRLELVVTERRRRTPMAEFATFVFTDLVGSVDLKSRVPGATAAERDEAYVRMVLTPHRARIEQGLAEAGGRVVSTAGDGHFLAFRDTVSAALWALAVQASHEDQPIEVARGELARVRMGLHAGVPQRDPNDEKNYIGRAVDYASRLADQASAGQVLASRSVASLLEDAGLRDLTLHSHGQQSLRGIGEVELFEVLASGRRPTAPRAEVPPPDQRQWTVLPDTMGLTEYHSHSSTGAATTLSPPTRLGNYELGELIGAGGMGNVYKARHTQFGRLNAIKLIKPELMGGGGDAAVRRFYQEVRATGSLEHPNLVVAIDSSTPEDTQHYLVMEYIDGVGVDRLLASEGRLGVGAACEIARQAALGLEHLGTQQLVHRDVKPSNLMVAIREDASATASSSASLTRAAVVKLMDLGLALLAGGDRERVTRIDHGGMGTGYYMSPEQWRTTSVDIRADIYSLGCTLYHLLTGEPPYAESDLRPQKAHEREPLPQASRISGTPSQLDDLVRQMMAKRPEDRPQRPLEVAQLLEPFADREALTTLVQSFDPSRRKPVSGAETQGPEQAVVETLPRHQRGSTLSKAAERARWLAPTAIAIVTALVALNLTWLIGDLRTQRLAKHRDVLRSTATQTASLLAQQIDRCFGRLESGAKQPELIEWMAAIEKAPEDDLLWQRPQEWISKQKLSADNKFGSSSWFITDQKGVQIARAPWKDTIGRSFARRDYFHGGGDDLNEDDPAIASLTPIDSQHLSVVYSSSKTGELKVAFSVPIDNGRVGMARRVIGVLAMSVELGDFTALADAEAANRTSSGIDQVEILLADTRRYTVDGVPASGLVLHHRQLDKRRSLRLPVAILTTITDSKTRSTDPVLDSYDDLFGRGRRYWGAFAPVVISNPSTDLDTKWVMIAQEPKP